MASESSSCEVDAAGVDEREAAAVPVGLELLAVAREAGLLVDDRLARFRQAVDQRRLADVRVADDRDSGQAGHLDAPRQVGDLRDDLLDRAVAGVDGRRVVGGDERRVLALLVLLVAQGLVAQDGLVVGAELLGAAAGALLGAGGEEDLELGVGRDDRADVAALGDPVAAVVQERRAACRRGRRGRP